MEVRKLEEQEFASKDWTVVDEENYLRSIASLEHMATKIMACLEILEKALTARINRELEKEGVTGTQVDVLFYLIHNINEGRKVTARELEQRFRVSNPTMSGILKRLEKKNLIERVPDKLDKRNKHIRLVADMDRLHETVDKRMQRESERIFAGFSDKEQKQMFDFLMRMIHNIDEMEKNDQGK